MATPQPTPWTPDWTSVPDEAIAPLLVESREQLQGVIAMGISSDQRSVALGGVFAAGAFALFTVSATVFTGGRQDLAMLYASATTGVLFMFASAFCLAAAFPVDFYVSGYAPRELFAYAEEPLWMQIATIQDFQRRIDANRATLARSARLIKWAIRFAFCGIIAGSVIALIGIFLQAGQQGATGPGEAMSVIVIILLALLTGVWLEADGG